MSGTHPFIYFGDISNGLEAHRSTWNAAKFGKINAFPARQEEDATQNDVAIYRAVKIVDAGSIEARNVPCSNSGVPRPVFVPVIKLNQGLHQSWVRKHTVSARLIRHGTLSSLIRMRFNYSSRLLLANTYNTPLSSRKVLGSEATRLTVSFVLRYPSTSSSLFNISHPQRAPDSIRSATAQVLEAQYGT